MEILERETDANKDQQLRPTKMGSEETKINKDQQKSTKQGESSIVITNHHKSSPPFGAVIKNHQ
jgi:hypothetical protein